MTNNHTKGETTGFVDLISAAYQILSTEIKNKFSEDNLSKLLTTYKILKDFPEIDLNKYELPIVYIESSSFDKIILLRLLLEDVWVHLEEYTS